MPRKRKEVIDQELVPATRARLEEVDGEEASCAVLHRPHAKWRALGLRVNFTPILDQEAVDVVHQIAFSDFHNCYDLAVEEERVRVQARLKELQLGKKGKRPTSRPTDKAYKMMRERKLVCNKEIVFGHVPGVAIGDAFDYKVQLSAVGVHHVVMNGITYASKGSLFPDSPSLAVSIVVSGWYEDDDDSKTEMLYTGQGGNDLHGRRLQIQDQKLERGNLALYNNAVYGMPVRVVKKNDEKLIYDGLWDVLQMIKRRGSEGFIVYQYRMTRCPGQEQSSARKVRFLEGTSMKNGVLSSIAPVNEICEDYSRGISDKPVSVVNNVDDELPPGLTLDDLLEEARVEKNWKVASDEFTFGLEMKYVSAIPDQDTPEVPEQYRHMPHEYLLHLNSGMATLQKKGILRHAMSILYTCGPWLKCIHGQDCDHGITSRQPKWRFQLYKTQTRGWGLKTLDRIPNGSFVMKYIGEVYSIDDIPPDTKDYYSIDMAKRPDYTDDNIYLPVSVPPDVHYTVTGRSYGNLFRYINHSCDPNCFIQPVLSDHLDRSRPDITIFAMRTIFPGEEISYDYGMDYIENLLENNCHCGSACCTKRKVETDDDLTDG